MQCDECCSMFEILEGTISADIKQYHAFRACGECGEPVGTWLEGGGNCTFGRYLTKFVNICSVSVNVSGLVISCGIMRYHAISHNIMIYLELCNIMQYQAVSQYIK
jgi:hypothetical protein